MSIRDHFTVQLKVKAPQKEKQQHVFQRRNWKAVDINVFQNDLLKTLDLNAVHSSDAIVDLYNNVMTKLADKYAPSKTKTIRRNPNQWYSDELKIMKRERRRLERKFKKTKDPADHHLLKSHSYNVSKILRSTRIEYNKDLIKQCGTDKKQLHSLSNKLMGCKERNVFPKHTSVQQLANDFIYYFQSKVRTIQLDIQKKQNAFYKDFFANSFVPENRPPSLNSFNPTSDEEIKDIILSLANKQCKLDPIPTWFLKKNVSVLAPIIKDIVNASFEEASVPRALKTAVIRPILKGDDLDHDIMRNYRPVSNLSILGKILEKAVYRRLNYHISEYNLLDENQSAYRKNHSTETVLVQIQNDILLELDKGKTVALVMIDISAAFDTVKHEKLIQCLTQYFGITGKAIEWMVSYLHNRLQSVVIQSEQSKSVIMEFGFPQGAILAGLIYIMFSTPLKKVVQQQNPIHKGYADDNQCYISFKVSNSQVAIQELKTCLVDMMNWMVYNGLKVNDDKTKFIIFAPNRNINIDTSLHLEHEEIKPVTEVKNLGVTMDNLMNLEKQINKTTRSVYFQIKKISKIRQFLDAYSTKALVQALVISRLDYCNALYVNLPQRLINKLQKAQNSAARLIFRKRRNCHITPVLKMLHWLPVSYRVQFKILMLTYKVLNNSAPQYLKSLVVPFQPRRQLRSNQHSYLTLLTPVFKKRKHGGRSFRNVAPRLWNSLPLHIRKAETLQKFKSMVKTHLFIQKYGN